MTEEIEKIVKEVEELNDEEKNRLEEYYISEGIYDFPKEEINFDKLYNIKSLIIQLRMYKQLKKSIKFKLKNGQLFSGIITYVDPVNYRLIKLDTPETKDVIVLVNLIEPSSLIPIEIDYTPNILFQREPLSQSLRFFVLNRDNYTCQYCGRKPPEVQLEVDHKIAVYNGGTNDVNNLITSCFDCNRGKSNKPYGNIL